MKKTFKKIVAYVVIIVIFAVSAAGMTVSAAVTQFSFTSGGKDPYYYITLNKDNDMNYAIVNITSGNLSSFVRIWITDHSGRKITSTKTITGTGIYILSYSTPILYGESVKFCVSASYHSLQITGTIEV